MKPTLDRCILQLTLNYINDVFFIGRSGEVCFEQFLDEQVEGIRFEQYIS